MSDDFYLEQNLWDTLVIDALRAGKSEGEATKAADSVLDARRAYFSIAKKETI